MGALPIIWLQGIWLPLHDYAFDRTPLWAGIFLLPLTTGFLLGGPASGFNRVCVGWTPGPTRGRTARHGSRAGALWRST
ncbi:MULTISPECIES: hypothetical protein [Kitasatospora]|uniref:Uncharacterized protein n=1 Tax=Kitasatospora cathayae TaxID=3004092 RepID=A0ABY7QI37_9ACTN|nr:hypothetical protein [Kitasatospora sp. HUAS 3-15]WBP91909.1 hypothetical protein O1G21_02970 [Kitasatospora sp. HUAS 3-15]